MTLPPTIFEGEEPIEGRTTPRPPHDPMATLKRLHSNPLVSMQDSIDRVMRTGQFSSVEM